MAPWQLLLIFYTVVGVYLSTLICAAISLTGGMDDASPGDWIVTFIVHVAIWPYTLRRLVNDAILLD